jgi:hypothetical protein
LRNLKSAFCILGLLSACSGDGTTQEAATGLADTVAIVLTDTGTVESISSLVVARTETIDIERLSTGEITKLTLSNTADSVAFDTGLGHTINKFGEGDRFLTAQSSSAEAVFAGLPNSAAGVYKVTTSEGNGFVATTYAGPDGISSFVPTGTATYDGGLVGLYFETGFGTVYTRADMTAAANFDSGNITFSTNGTEDFNPATGASGIDRSELDIPATVIFQGDDNNKFVSGELSDGSGLTGSAEIALFGSSGEEMAGIGTLTDDYENFTNATRVHLISFTGQILD